MYIVRTLTKESQVDNWEEGLVGSVTSFDDIRVGVTGETVYEVLEKVAQFCSAKLDSLVVNPENRAMFEFSLLGDNDNIPLSQKEIELWRKGEFKAWHIVYLGRLEKIDETFIPHTTERMILKGIK